MLKRRLHLLLILLVLTSGATLVQADFFAKLGQLFSSDSSPHPTRLKAIGTIEVAFSPNNGATSSIVKAIGEAKTTILVSAYSFTSQEIAAALLAAKKRGVAIKLILDKSQVSQKYSSSTFFYNQGFEQRIDIKHAIYHDKVMIIDSKTVITGSFNFTKAAEYKNAENLLILRDNPELAKLYSRDWWFNWQQAIPRDAFILKYPSKNTNDPE